MLNSLLPRSNDRKCSIFFSSRGLLFLPIRCRGYCFNFKRSASHIVSLYQFHFLRFSLMWVSLMNSPGTTSMEMLNKLKVQLGSTVECRAHLCYRSELHAKLNIFNELIVYALKNYKRCLIILQNKERCVRNSSFIQIRCKFLQFEICTAKRTRNGISYA